MACMTDVEAGLLRSDAWAGDLENDQVLGAMLLDASFVHHALAVLDEGQWRQYQFWQAVFGTECLDGSLYFFDVKSIAVFKRPQEIPVTDRRKLEFFQSFGPSQSR